MSGDWQEPGASYIPERYRQQIAAKKRRQLGLRIAAVVFVIAVCAAIFFFLTGFGQSPTTEAQGQIPPVTTQAVATSPVPGTSATTPATGGISASSVPETGNGTSGPTLSPALLQAQNETGIISYTSALRYLSEDFPASAFTLKSADIQTLSPGRQVYAFIVRPAHGSAADALPTVYIDAVTGDPYSPSQENATIMPGTVRNSISNNFPGLHPDRIRVRYSVPANGQPVWNFALYVSNVTRLTGSYDAMTGDLISFNRITALTDRQSIPLIDNITAQKIAERYISDRNGPVSIELTTERYAPLGSISNPLAGTWVLGYSRLVQDYPCDIDGFTMSVDSVTGDIAGYERRWSDPEYAFATSPIQTVLQREATYTVLRKAQDTFPGLVTGITVISTDVRWKDGHPAGTVPRPGSIRLAWKVVFDDEIIRSEPSPVPAIAWVDVQSGSLLDFDYRH